MPVPVKKCALCGCAARIVAESVPGYQQGKTYTIYECEGCSSSFAAPLTVDETLYGHIYNCSQGVPGYNRYYHYAREVLNRKRPLDYLSRQEESYWAVARHLREIRTARTGMKVLELGCGLGYFTYALTLEGFEVTGVDISAHAINWAREQYGSNYEKATLQDLNARGMRYDAVVMNQLIEHVPDVHGFFEDALHLLTGEGELVLTTPDKTTFPGAEWDSDLPPVHLWWFGEESMRYLARRHGCEVAFIDFAPFYDAHFRPKERPLELIGRQPVLNDQGAVNMPQEIPHAGIMKRMLEQTGALDILRAARGALQGVERIRGSRGPVMAAVFRKSARPAV